MTRAEILELVLAAFDAEMEVMIDRVTREAAGIGDKQRIEEVMRFEVRRSEAGMQRRADKLVEYVRENDITLQAE